MSVSAIERPVTTTPQRTSSQTDTKAKTPAEQTGGGQGAGISFSSRANQSGPVFGESSAKHVPCRPDPCYSKPPKPPKPDPCRPDPCYSKPPKPPKPDPCRPDPCYSKPPKPPKPDPCRPDPCYSKPPAPCKPQKPDPEYCRPTPGKPEKPDPGYCRPDPCKPDPYYSKMSNDQLAQRLLDNFDGIKSPSTSWLTTTDLRNMADKPLTGSPGMDRNIRLAQELLRRPEIVQAVDRHSTTGALDGIIDKTKIRMILNSDNPYKYQGEQELAHEMLRKFEGLKDVRYPQYINIEKLKEMAKWPLTGNRELDELIYVSKEIAQRSELMRKMDDLGSRDKDGWIHKEALRQLSR